MQELIPINYEGDAPSVSGRELHEQLQVKTEYRHWFPRQCEYGFDEGKDFRSKMTESTGGRPAEDHELTLNMAKEVAMIQRTEMGKKIRQYLISVEDAWNTPGAVMARALKMADTQIKQLQAANGAMSAQVEEMMPKACYYDLILACKDLIPITTIAKDYGKSAIWLNNWLQEQGIQFKQSKIWYLYQKYAEQDYTQSQTHPIKHKNGKPGSKTHTYWTQKGRRFIYEQLKSAGILPAIERAKSTPKKGATATLRAQGIDS